MVSSLRSVLQYNTLNEYLPQYDDLPRRLMRSAVIGFSASAISDTCSNSVRVVKTTKQTSTVPMTYPEVVRVRPTFLQRIFSTGSSACHHDTVVSGACVIIFACSLPETLRLCLAAVLQEGEANCITALLLYLQVRQHHGSCQSACMKWLQCHHVDVDLAELQLHRLLPSSLNICSVVNSSLP